MILEFKYNMQTVTENNQTKFVFQLIVLLILLHWALPLTTRQFRV